MVSSSTFFAYQLSSGFSAGPDFKLSSILSDWHRWCPVYLIWIRNDAGDWISLKQLAPNGFKSIQDLEVFFATYLFNKVVDLEIREKCISQAFFHFHQAGILVATKLYTVVQTYNQLIDHASCPQQIFLSPCVEGVIIHEKFRIQSFNLEPNRVLPKNGLNYHGQIDTYSLFCHDHIEVQNIQVDFPSRTLAEFFEWPKFIQGLINFVRSLFGYPPLDFEPLNKRLAQSHFFQGRVKQALGL
jgi:hypothetical protein